MSSDKIRPVGGSAGDDPRIDPDSLDSTSKQKGEMPAGRSVEKREDTHKEELPKSKRVSGPPFEGREVEPTEAKDISQKEVTEDKADETKEVEEISLSERKAADKTLEGKRAFKRAIFDAIDMARIGGIVLITSLGRVIVKGEKEKENLPEAIGMVAGNLAHALSRVIIYGVTKGIDKAAGTTLTEKAYNSGMGDLIAAIPQQTLDIALRGGAGIIIALVDVALPVFDPAVEGIREAVKGIGQYMSDDKKKEIKELVLSPLGKLEDLSDEGMEKLNKAFFGAKEAIEKTEAEQKTETEEESTSQVESIEEKEKVVTEEETEIKEDVKEPSTTTEKAETGIIAGTTPPKEITVTAPKPTEEKVEAAQAGEAKAATQTEKPSAAQSIKPTEPLSLIDRKAGLPALRFAKNSFFEALFNALEMIGLALRIIIGGTGKFLMSGGKTGDELVASAEIALGNLANATSQALLFTVTGVADLASFGQLGLSEQAKSSGFADAVGSAAQSIIGTAAKTSTRIIVVVLDPALEAMGPLIAKLSELAVSTGKLLPEETQLYLKGLPADAEDWLDEHIAKLKLAIVEKVENKLGDLGEDEEQKPPDASPAA
tara:strand:+ start:3112 stop:4911 length:1800 start_codon:yes stop_codon:yes gene_type:complete